MVLLVVGCCSHKPLASLRAAAPEGRHCCRNPLSHPFLWVTRASKDEQILQNKCVRNLRKGRSEQAVSTVCVREGLSGHHPHLDSSLGQSFPWAVARPWSGPALCGALGAGKGLTCWIWIFLVALFLFSHPVFEFVSLQANANRAVNIHPEKLHICRANSKTTFSESQRKPCSSPAAA